MCVDEGIALRCSELEEGKQHELAEPKPSGKETLASRRQGPPRTPLSGRGVQPGLAEHPRARN
jgi:hypothetical protein